MSRKDTTLQKEEVKRHHIEGLVITFHDIQREIKMLKNQGICQRFGV